jgi:subtilisin family serine protease
MKKQTFSLITILTLIALVVPLGGTGLTQGRVNGSEEEAITAQPTFYDFPVSKLADGLSPEGGGLAQVVIELHAEPTAQTFAAAQERFSLAAATQAAQAQLAHIEQAQQALLTPLAAMGAEVLYRTQRVYNGIAAIVPADTLGQIAVLPGVKAIHPLPLHKADNTTSVPLIGAPELWDSAGLDLRGDGITIGIIDTGVDYLHADFGGFGGITGTLYLDNDTTIIGDVPGFPGAKVVGGWDFAGDSYNPDDLDPGYQPIPMPDPDPMDCNGHGSHVAGTAGGYGVELDGDTYTGPYPPATPFTSTFRIGPGVAPGAEIYALRIFGCEGPTGLTSQAIEWAVDPNGDGDFSDHLDVINMSLGAPYGANDEPSAVASNNAALAGVIVVTSAGNSGEPYYVTGSPGVADRAISTAGSVDSGAVLDGFRVNPPSPLAGVHAGLESVLYDWMTTTLPITGTLVYPEVGPDPAMDQRTGCYTFSITNTNMISGNIALLNWTEPSCGGSVTRTGNAFAAGAIGVLLADDSDVFDLFISGSDVIPALSIPRSIGDALAANLPLSMTFSHEYANSILFIDESINDVVYSSSSRGPRSGDSMLKPDIAAPAVSVFSAAYGTGDEGASFNGTSMASPHVAGSMALLRELHPFWTVEELKALAMNTALMDVRSAAPMTSTVYGPSRIGAGRIHLPYAVASDVVAYNPGAPGNVSVSFGAVEVAEVMTATRHIRLHNKQTTPLTFTVAYSGVTDIPGVAYSLSPAQVNVPALGWVDVAVTMTADPALMRHVRYEGVSPVGPRQWLSEESGYAVFRPEGAGQMLRLPIYVTARPASEMMAAASQVDLGSDIALAGQGFNTGGGTVLLPPPDTASVLTIFEAQYMSANESASQGLVNEADLEYVGVASDFAAAGTITDTMLFFGIATHGNWSSPNAPEFDIYIDADRDGSADYAMFNTDAGEDLFVSRVLDLSTFATVGLYYLNGVPASGLDTVPFNTSVMVMPVAAADLGLTPTGSDFDYWVVSFSRYADGVVEVSDLMTYNGGGPGMDFNDGATGVPAWPDLDGLTIPVSYDLNGFIANGTYGALLLHHHNGAGNHAEIVNVAVPTLYMPVVFKRFTP